MRLTQEEEQMIVLIEKTRSVLETMTSKLNGKLKERGEAVFFGSNMPLMMVAPIGESEKDIMESLEYPYKVSYVSDDGTKFCDVDIAGVNVRFLVPKGEEE